MSEIKNSGKSAAKNQELNKQIPSNVVSISEHKCKFVECKKSPEKANFCKEHFIWFKEGLLTKDGTKAPDFDKKYYNYKKRSA